MSIPDEIREERGASIASMDSTMRSGTATFCVSPSSAASQAVTVSPRRLFPASLRRMGEQLANIGEGDHKSASTNNLLSVIVDEGNH
jgi:hypothetical protein